MRTHHVLILLWMLLLSFPAGASRAGKDKEYRPVIDPANFQAAIDNPYYPLLPGTIFRYVETSGKKTADIEVSVTRDTKIVMGVTCTVVHTIVQEKGNVEEETLGWYAQDRHGNVWYFGEDAKEFHKGGGVSTRGSWRAGVGANQPGIVMPGNPARGAPYRQSYCPGQEEDMGQIVATKEAVTVAHGAYADCVRTREWSLLSAGSEKKWYSRGVGCIKEVSPEGDVTELVTTEEF